jgi:hypothetical protein
MISQQFCLPAEDAERVEELPFFFFFFFGASSVTEWAREQHGKHNVCNLPLLDRRPAKRAQGKQAR